MAKGRAYPANGIAADFNNRSTARVPPGARPLWKARCLQPPKSLLPRPLPPAPAGSSAWLRSTAARACAWGGGVVAAGVIAAAIFYGRSPDYRVLFSGLNDKDGGAIVAQLTTMNVPYNTPKAAAPSWCRPSVHDVRLRLATQGPPKGLGDGFELMETNRFGVTQFQERLNFQRGLEGELTRSIQALASVQKRARAPGAAQSERFLSRAAKPSASVLLSLYPAACWIGRSWRASCTWWHPACPSWRPGGERAGRYRQAAVAVARRRRQQWRGRAAAGLQQIEQQYTRRILDLLEPVVGKNNVKAQVTAEVDFNQTESTVEQHRPNLSPDASAVRSQQIVESGGDKARSRPRACLAPSATSRRRAPRRHQRRQPVPPTAANAQQQPGAAGRQARIHHQLRGGQDHA